MKLSRIAGALSLAAVAGLVSAPVSASSFSIKRPYVLYYIDGAKTSFFFFFYSSKFDLSQGEHQVVVRFEGAFRDGRETRIVTSEPVVINFSIDDPSVDYVLDFKYPRNYDKATEYAANPVVTLLTSDGKAVSDAEIFVLPHKPGLQIGRDYLREIDELGKGFHSENSPNNTVLVANANGATLDTQKTIELEKKDVSRVVTEKAKVEPTTVADVEKLNKTSQDARSAVNPKLEKLKKAYLEADPETQKLFKVWMVTRE